MIVKTRKQKTNTLNLNTLKRVVIKIGSNVLTDHHRIRRGFFSELAEEIAFLKARNIQPVLVSSGAIATGMSASGVTRRPVKIPELQALAAIGQPILMNLFAKEFARKHLTVAQVLLTQDGLEDRSRFINAKHALGALIRQNVIPIVNENDTVTVEEIKIGDNDQLSAHVAHLVEADLLVILSHVEGLYDRDPNVFPNARLVVKVRKIDKRIRSMVYEAKDERTTGGMATKLISARICMEHGIPVIITSGFNKNFIRNIFSEKIPGTLFLPSERTLTSRKHWIGNVRKPRGVIKIDPGAKKALLRQKKSLLPSGVIMLAGEFKNGDCVEIRDRQDRLVGKGLTSYSRDELERIMGHKSSEIEKILGYKYGNAVVHRNDLVLSS